MGILHEQFCLGLVVPFIECFFNLLKALFRADVLKEIFYALGKR